MNDLDIKRKLFIAFTPVVILGGVSIIYFVAFGLETRAYTGTIENIESGCSSCQWGYIQLETAGKESILFEAPTEVYYSAKEGEDVYFNAKGRFGDDFVSRKWRDFFKPKILPQSYNSGQGKLDPSIVD